MLKDSRLFVLYTENGTGKFCSPIRILCGFSSIPLKAKEFIWLNWYAIKFKRNEENQELDDRPGIDDRVRIHGECEK
jgi:hypothetical protein